MPEENIKFLPEDDLIPVFKPFTQLSQSTDWGLMQANIPAAHKFTKGAGITVAILDTGAPNHNDVNPNLLKAIDCSGDGDANDLQGHGTHVAGIVAACDNDFGILGVAPEAKLVAIKVLDNGGHGGYSNIEQGIRAAMAEGVDIINMSLGSPIEPPQSFHQAIIDAANQGIFIVAAAGNDSGAVNWPARYPEVIAVGAIDQNGNLTNFSSLGPQISVIAPGDNIYSTYLNNQYAILRGTSQASPFVAGLCALILAKHRSDSSLAEVKSLQDMYRELDRLCDPKGKVITGKEGNIGFGIPKDCNNI